MSNNLVFVPKPEMTIFNDTFLECEVVGVERFNQWKLRVKSVKTGNGNELPELTARNEDSIITVSKRKVFNSVEEMKLAS